MPNRMVLQELKRLIVLKNKILVISPSDCRIISLSIQKELKKNVSETTIKRLFGFAEIKHEFSKFTINTLKEYVGMVDEPLVGFASNFHHNILLESIDYQRLLAERITAYTLQNIRNRCSVPYEMTIPRAFAMKDFEFFYHSEYSYTAFISQPGYGKSILLSHLIEKIFLKANSTLKKNIIFFINADHLFTREMDELSLEDRIKIKLSLPDSIDLMTYFNVQWEKYGIKLIVIIDGFSEVILNKNAKPQILECIAGFIASIGQSESVKLVLSMRSTIWNRFNESVRHSYFIKRKWFQGSHFNLNDNSNVPSLTESEVKKIFQKMSPLDFSKISDRLKLQLKFPFHIQWYYQLKEEYPAFESYTNIIYYEIISRFIQEKIYNSTHATEKVLFCKIIVQLTNYGRRGYTVSKIDLIKEMPIFGNAYDELLANGILMEEKQLKNGIPIERVRFIQPHIFEYFLFIQLYDLFDNKMDKRFFELINTEYNGNQVRFQLLQWAIRLMVKLYRLKDMEAVLSLNINNYEKNYLIYFIAENLKYNSANNPKLIAEIKAQALHSLLIKKLIHFDFIDSCYKDAINCLIDVVDNEDNALFYHTILAMFDCLSADQERISNRLIFMSKMAKARKKWLMDPYEIVRLIYLKIKGVTLTHTPLLSQIDEFKKNEGILSYGDQALPNTAQILNFLLMLMLNLFYGTSQEAIQIISTITKLYPKLKKSRKFFSIYLLNILAQASARDNPGAKTDQMENILVKLYADVRNDYTAYSQSLLLSLQAEQSKNRKDYYTAIKYAEEGLAIYKRNQFTINELYTYKLIINIYESLGEKEKVERYTQLKNLLMTKKKINLQMFN
jgi:hypothetical protein